MWRTTPRLATAALLATLTLAAATAPKADAAATVQTYNYSTSGSIPGMPNTGPVQFVGLGEDVPTGSVHTLTTPGSFSLGGFQANPLPATATLTFNNTPFAIDLVVASQPDIIIAPEYDYHISGVLNGSINGAGSSSLYAAITSITGNDHGLGTTPPFPVSDLTVLVPAGISAPNGALEGFGSLFAQVVLPGFPLPAPAPEPTSIAAFAAALAGLALRRRLRSRAAADA